MPDFDRLHELSRKLAALTAPGEQEIGLISWCQFVGETWGEIARMWEADPKRAAAEELYAALESLTDLLTLAGARGSMIPFSFIARELTDATFALLKANPERKEPA